MAKGSDLLFILIKFQENNPEYAYSLLNEGRLFMQSAEAYINQEKKTGKKGQGDFRETLVFDTIRIGIDYPIYCMSGVYKHQIIENTILIDKRVINDFCETGGYITVIKTMDFLTQFKSSCQYEYDIGMVIYSTKRI